MSSCNNTTYAQMVFGSKELMREFYKYSFFMDMLEYNAPVAMMINKTVTPIWITLGIFGNLLSAFVWSSRIMRSCPTIAYYLTCLSLADLTFLIIHIFYELEAPWLVGALDAQGWCQIFSVINISVQYFCVFLVFAFTIERFLSICYPFKSERFGKTRTPRIIKCLLVLCILLGIPQAYFWDLNTVGECQVRRQVNTMTNLSFYSIYTWSTELAIFGVLPILVLFLNMAVVLKINRVATSDLGNIKFDSKSGERLINNHHHHEYSHRIGGGGGGGGVGGGGGGRVGGGALISPSNSKKSNTSEFKKTTDTHVNHSNNKVTKKSSNGSAVAAGAHNANHRGTTITLLWVSFFLIFTMLPNTIVYALQHNAHFGPMPCRIEDMGGDPHWRSYFTFQTIKLIIKEISLSHHVVNVFIYMATSGRFVRQVTAFLHIRSKSSCWNRQSSNDSPARGNSDQGLHRIPRSQTESYNHSGYVQHAL